jgi:tetratricopeptide (TPR) repeat protein
MIVEDRQVQVLLEQADVQRRLGNYRGAIELLQRALALDPDHARAHALLAIALLDARRLPGALIEMRAALNLDGNDRFVHYTAAAVLRAARKLEDAWHHCLVALDGEDVDAQTYVLGARIQMLRDDRTRARELLADALELDATHVAALTVLARLEMDAGELGAAAEHIELALRTDPADRDAHVTAGFIALARGDVASAEGHARYVLNQTADDPSGMELFVAIKARKSRVLGAWWRFNSWLTSREDSRRITLMIGMFVVVRLIVIIADELEWERFATVIDWLWIATCVYTWFAPVLFRHWLQKELGTVKLNPDF